MEQYSLYSIEEDHREDAPHFTNPEIIPVVPPKTEQKKQIFNKIKFLFLEGYLGLYRIGVDFDKY